MGGADNGAFLQNKRRKAQPASKITPYLLDALLIAGSKNRISMGIKEKRNYQKLVVEESKGAGCENCWQRLGRLDNCLMCWRLNAALSKVQRLWNVGN